MSPCAYPNCECGGGALCDSSMYDESVYMITQQGMVAQFYYEKMGRIPVPYEARAALVEEIAELTAALALGAEPEDFLKELADVLYTCYGLATAEGWNLVEAFRLVHESNMTKQKTASGKIQKGENYVAPDLSGCV